MGFSIKMVNKEMNKAGNRKETALNRCTHCPISVHLIKLPKNNVDYWI